VTVPAGDQNQPNYLDPEYKGKVLFAETGQLIAGNGFARPEERDVTDAISVVVSLGMAPDPAADQE
jgi:hypothetical protein